MQWFNQGRQTRNGKTPAEMRVKAYQRKMQMRAAQQRASGAAAQSSNVTVGGENHPWMPLGPVPINDSTVAPTGYGPLAGRVTAIAVDQKDTTGNTVYTAGAYGGLWKSTNAAAPDPTSVKWTPLIDDQPTLAVGSIALQPGSSNVILVGTGEPNYAGDSYYGVGILRSTDGGVTWNQNPNVAYGNQYYDLFGMGISQIAFSTKNPNFVVAAVSAYTVGAFSLNAIPSNGIAGLIYSSDAGATWTIAPLTDDGTNLYATSASSVVYNPTEDKFYAAVPFHGFYVSNGTASAGFTTFKRMASQPGTALPQATCPASGSKSCPMVRGVLTVRPVLKSGDPNQMFAWFVSDGSGDAKDDMGIWQFSDSGGAVSWKQISTGGIANCGDVNGCGTRQSAYNLYLSAVPNGGSATDLYAGTINIYKCSLSSSNPTCTSAPFLNLTHVYGCSTISMVHPDQHAIDFLTTNPNLIYFGNDGGVYRTLVSQSTLKTGTCPAGNTKANAFDNLNMNIGALTQFVWGSQHPSDPTTLMGGTQDNGTMGVSGSAPAAGDLGWWEVDNGDGGYTQIDPVNPGNWYTEYYGVSLQSCPNKGINCNAADFNWLVAESAADNLHQVDGDESNFYMPWLLDPADPTKLILGTCRVWRGPNDASKWPNYSIGNAISHKLTLGGDAACGAGDDYIAGVAAGGPSTAAGSQVIWATTTGGHVYMTSNATSAIATWTDVTGTINPNNLQISAIALDPHDPTGMTAAVGLQGYPSNLWITTNGGATWNNLNYPPGGVPINDILFDSDERKLFFATDTGVYWMYSYGGDEWEVGPNAPDAPGYLPNVTVFHIAMYKNGTDKRLRAWTHGRGVWETPITPGDGVGLSPDSLSFETKPTVRSIAWISDVVNLDPVTVTLGPPVISGPNASAFSIDPTNTSCTTTLPAISECYFGFTFLPMATGTYSATATITTTDPYNPTLTLNLHGTGDFIGVTIYPNTLNYYQNVNSTSTDQSVWITNADIVPITLGTPTLSGANASEFAFGTGGFNQCDVSVPLPQGAECSIPIHYAPNVQGTAVATFSITTTSKYTSNLSMSLSGYAPPPTATDFSYDFGANPTTATVTAGQSASYSFNIDTTPAGASLVSNLTFSCSGNPSKTSCSFSPASMTGGGAVTLTIATTAQSSAARASSIGADAGNSSPLGWSMVLPGLLLLLPRFVSRSRSQRWLMYLGTLTLWAALLGLVACGGGGGSITPPPPPVVPGTPAGTYTIHITGTSGSITHAQGVTLTVQ